VETIHNNDGFENRLEVLKKVYKNFQKCANLNTVYEVKKQHSQPKMTAIPLFHLSQSRMRIKLLK